jgi:hypothetical protein
MLPAVWRAKWPHEESTFPPAMSTMSAMSEAPATKLGRMPNTGKLYQRSNVIQNEKAMVGGDEEWSVLHDVTSSPSVNESGSCQQSILQGTDEWSMPDHPAFPGSESAVQVRKSKRPALRLVNRHRRHVEHPSARVCFSEDLELGPTPEGSRSNSPVRRAWRESQTQSLPLSRISAPERSSRSPTDSRVQSRSPDSKTWDGRSLGKSGNGPNGHASWEVCSCVETFVCVRARRCACGLSLLACSCLLA